MAIIAPTIANGCQKLSNQTIGGRVSLLAIKGNPKIFHNNYLEGHKMLCEEENHAILIREHLKPEVLSLTDSQVEYVLWRLECLLQEEN